MNGMDEAIRQLREAAAARKCWPCGCLHGAVAALEGSASPDLSPALGEAKERLLPAKYDCLGCEVCYPALALNALGATAAPCPGGDAAERDGWPPLAGAYTVLRYRAPVAVCTLTDDALAAAIAKSADEGVAIVGTLATENLGIERLIANLVADPYIRFLVIAGADSRQVVGHRPGQSLVALARSGIDDRSRIVGAEGKRPVLRNVERRAIDHFRATVEVVDLVGSADVEAVLAAVRACAARDPGPTAPFEPEVVPVPWVGCAPRRMVPDPAGYFVVFVDRGRRRLWLEHYRKNGVMDEVIEGRTAAELYAPAIEKELVSRLDHAAYLGRELARAERALATGEPYVQDGATEGR